jgi:hypothetical protein
MANATPAKAAPAKVTAAKKAPAKMTAPVLSEKVLVEPVGTPKVETLSLPTTITLPHWSDAGSVTSFFMTIVTFALGVLTMTHVTVPAGTSDNVSTFVGILGVAIAAGFQVVNYVRVSVLHKAAINNGVAVINKKK